jgi:prephenate dehydrogenase
MAKSIITIIGFGPIGRRFAHLFSQDFDVRVSSTRDVKEEVTDAGATIATDRCLAISNSDYIFLAVPLSALQELIAEVNDHAYETAVVIDCCSARVPAEQMLSRLNCQHFGMHDVRTGEFSITGSINAEMTEFFALRNIGINILSPEEHDRINAVIGLGHFLGLSLGKFLDVEQKDILSAIGSGSKLIELVHHFAGNSPTTWSETQIDNQFTKDVRTSFLAALNQYHNALSKGEYPFERGTEPVSSGNSQG